MKKAIPLMMAGAIGLTLGSCKTPSKDGSSLSSLSIGNTQACKRTQERISEAYNTKELRSLAEKGHRFLIQEIAKGNKAAMITEAALRISTFQKGGELYAATVNQVFSGNASEAELNSFAERYNSTNGFREAVEVLRTAQRGVIAQFVAEVQANPQNSPARAEASEIVRDIVDWSNEMSSRFSANERAAAEGQPSLKAEADAVRAVVDTVLTEFLKANQKLAQSGIGQLAEVEVAQLELSKANANLAEGYQTQNAERMVAEVFRKYGNSPNPELRRAVAIQSIHMLNTAQFARPEARETVNNEINRLFSFEPAKANARRAVAEIVALEGLIEVAEQSGEINRANELKARLNQRAQEVARANNINGNLNVAEAAQRSSGIEALVREIGNRNQFESTSELSYYRSFYKRIAESARRGRERR